MKSFVYLNNNNKNGGRKGFKFVYYNYVDESKNDFLSVVSLDFHKFKKFLARLIKFFFFRSVKRFLSSYVNPLE